MLSRTDRGTLTLTFDGKPIAAHPGDSAAAALIAAGVLATRKTPVTATPRGAYCMMGACFDCLAVVDGRTSVQLCLVTVQEGMQIETQIGGAELE